MLIDSPLIRAPIYGIALFFGSIFSITTSADPTGEALVFPCYTCHGTDGQSPGSIPSLTGHEASDIQEKLMAFKRGQGDPTIMNRIAKGYTDDEIRRLSELLGALSETNSREQHK